jgi:DNA-binding MarR family transcriptional regulator
MIIDSTRIPGHLAGTTIKALCHLAEVGEARARDLAEVAGFTTAAATGLIDRGEKLGLLARGRTPGDRRTVVLALTDRGQELVESMKPEPETATEG